MSRIRVTIDHLVLKGVEPAARKAMVEALQQELSRAISDPSARGDWSGSRRTPVLRLGRMPLEPGPLGGRKFGNGLAKSIGRGIKS